ncbi:hypothetical protein DIPPA_16949 [Diplonema papillatum]|nr:hypothetical protein DIPPA_16949 [Diplonema papillatum]
MSPTRDRFPSFPVLAPYPVHGIANPGLVPAAPVRPGAALSPPTGSNPAGAAAPPPAPSAPPPEEAHDDEDDDGGGAVAALPSAPPLPADPPTQAAAPSASGGAVPRAHFFLFFDGASKGNPGPSGAGAYLLETESQEIRWRQSCGLPNGTNNEAEYHGLLIGLEQAVTMPHVTRLTVIGDSELVIKQMLGVYRVRASTLVGLHARAKDLCNRLRARRCRLSFRHIDRCLNALADSLANDGVQW